MRVCVLKGSLNVRASVWVFLTGWQGERGGLSRAADGLRASLEVSHGGGCQAEGGRVLTQPRFPEKLPHRGRPP